jgi:hypothetical protein
MLIKHFLAHHASCIKAHLWWSGGWWSDGHHDDLHSDVVVMSSLVGHHFSFFIFHLMI